MLGHVKNWPNDLRRNQRELREYSSCLPCTTNFSRGDFPAITAAKSDSRMKEFIFSALSCGAGS